MGQFIGGDEKNSFIGTTGSDYMDGGGGDDTLWGNGGRDQVFGGEGDDNISVRRDDRGVFDGGAGEDTLDISYLSFFSPFHAPIQFHFRNGAAQHTPDGARMLNFEHLDMAGSNYGDVITGGAMSDFIRGWDGDDVLKGAGGDDYVIGENGVDTLYGGVGNDTLSGGGHSDTLYGGRGDDVLYGGANFDVYTGEDVLVGGLGADSFFHGLSRITVSYAGSREAVYADLTHNIGIGGEAQGDHYDGQVWGVIGSAFDDVLTGGGALYGGDGNDRLVDSYGVQIMTGGAGVDRYVVENQVVGGGSGLTITDFDQAGGEKIDLSDIDAKGRRGDQAFAFIGDTAFTGKAGELRVEYFEGRTLIEGDVDGDTGTDFIVSLPGTVALTEADFVL